MTCDEYKTMFFRHPRECTTSENEANENHLHKCAECKKWVKKIVDEKIKTMDPIQFLFKRLLGELFYINHEIAVANDPELMEARKAQQPKGV